MNIKTALRVYLLLWVLIAATGIWYGFTMDKVPMFTALLLVIGNLVIAIRYLRCPYCGAFLGKTVVLTNCPHCGRELKDDE